MPIYEYQCTACGEITEALQKISDAPLTDCPACGAAALRKKISAVAFRLKGSGWYETDFKSDNQKNLAGDSAEKSAEGGGKDGKKDGGDTAAKAADSAKGGDSSSSSKQDSGAAKAANDS